MITFNQFARDPHLPNQFNIVAGPAVIGTALTLVKPMLIHPRGPAFSLINGHKLVAAFRPAAGGAYLGTHNGVGVVAYFNAHEGLDIFLTDSPAKDLTEQLGAGFFINEMYAARKRAA